MKGQRQKQWQRVLIFALIIGGVATFLLAPRFLCLHGSPKRQTNSKAAEYFSPTDAADKRGNIYDRNGEYRAVSYKTTAMYARPLEIKDPETVAGRLAELLELDKSDLLATLKSERNFVWLGHNLETDKVKNTAALNINGIYLMEEMNRYYPQGSKAAHVTGFVNNAQGLAGIEFYYNNILQGGVMPKHDLLRLASIVHSDVPFLQSAIKGNGADLALSLDMRLQTIVEQHLKKLMKQTGAAAAMAALLNTRTGDVLALVNLPSFDPNKFWAYDKIRRRNRIVTEPIYPAKLNRLFRRAAAFELYGDNVDAGNNDTAVDFGSLLTDDNRHLDLKILTMFSGQLGLNRQCRIDLPVDGYSRDKPRRPADDRAATPFFLLQDYSSTTTALQLLTAFSRLINGGRQIKPHLLTGIRSRATGEKFSADYPKTGHASKPRIIRPATGRAILKLLNKSGSPGPDDAVFLESILTDNRHVHPENAGPATSDKVPTATAQGVMLGAAPKQSPKLSLIVVLDRCRIAATGRTSPMISTGRRLMPALLKIAKASKADSAGYCWEKTSADNYYQQPLKKNTTAVNHAVGHAAREDTLMPDLIGKSLRKGLQALQKHNISLEIIGAGRIVAQHPRPGVVLKGKEICMLKLGLRK